MLDPFIYGRFVKLPEDMNVELKGLVIIIRYIGLVDKSHKYMISIGPITPSKNITDIIHVISYSGENRLLELADFYEGYIRKSTSEILSEINRGCKLLLFPEILIQRGQIIKDYLITIHNPRVQ